MKLNDSRIRQISWVLALMAVLVSAGVWGQGLGWQFDRLSSYKMFPLFGLMAFGLMWSHYIIAALRLLAGLETKTTKQFFDITSLAVLVLILLHPGLLVYQLWNDGFGLPPGSYMENYVASGLKWAAILGPVSLAVFIIYELRHWCSQKPWWKYIQGLSDIAMLAILVHGFKLGSHLQGGWFRLVWAFYAVTLVAALGIIYKGGFKLMFERGKQ